MHTMGTPRIPIPSQPIRVVPGAAVPCASALQRMHRTPVACLPLHKDGCCFPSRTQ